MWIKISSQTSRRKWDMSKEETIIKGIPPNLDAIQERFTATKGNLRVIYTYYPHIYVQVEAILPDDLMVHEATHLAQQEMHLPALWWDRYLKDDEFLLEQEIQAYGNQLAYALLIGPRARADRLKDQLASDLASDVYGKIISFTKAETAIRYYAKTV